MDFSILGPVRVQVDGAEVPLGAAKPRALLVRLLVDANRTVSAERLIDDLWEGDPPRSAGQTLQTYVSQLRKVLGGERLLTRGGGYELRVEPGELDADRFERTVAEARDRVDASDPARGLPALDDALTWWRGTPLAESAGAAWASATVARLEETRIAAIEAGLGARLALGRYSEVIGAAEAAIAEYPLRERLWALLMTALYQDQRQAEALRAFQRLRRLLADELGIDPSRELNELEARMVRQEPDLEPAVSASAPGPARSTATLTFVFTDLVTSTRMWEEHGAEMADALARHDGILRAAVERNGGRVVKTTGDGTIAAFEDPVAAVQSAIDAQHELAAAQWGATGPLRARIALHTGVAESRDGDYFGPALNRAARIMAIGHGGQVLISQATESVIRDAMSFAVLDLGEHRLRDLSRSERVYQVVVPGQAAEFPALRSVDVSSSNLPVQLTTFIGRTGEVKRVRDLLAQHRVVTITGVGGVGKTRIALRVAGEMAGEFVDGAWCSELAAATDAESMLNAIAVSLRIPPRTDMAIEASVIDHFTEKALLWVLDNCEHLLGPAAQLVDRVLRASPNVRVLVTSREALDVDGEAAMPLRSMTVAASDELEAIGGSDAVRLFVERAANARAGFELDESNAATVNTICRRLDGIPLAIELAAVRVVAMSPTDIADRLDERFRLLTGGRRVALERHQTLRAAVEWSYGLLDDRERVVFERLAVFSGTFDAAAATAVVGDETLAEWDVIDALDGLVRKSLVIAETQDDGGTRYQLLETLRQYALDRLAERGDVDDWRERHARYFAEFVGAIARGLFTPDEYAWRARRGPELANLRAAIAWATDTEDAGLLMALASGLSEEALTLWGNQMGMPATRALGLVEQLPLDQQVGLLMLAALEAYAQGDIESSTVYSLQAEDRAEGVDAIELTACFRQAFSPNFGMSALRSRAVVLVRDTPERLTAIGLSTAEIARTYASLASFLIQGGGDRELAAGFIEHADRLAIESRNPSTLAFSYFAQAQLYARDDADRALFALDRCIELNEEGAALASTGASYYMSALIHARRGEREIAVTRLRAALEFLAPRGRSPELDGAFGYSIETLATLGEAETAVTIVGAVLGGMLQVLREVKLPPDREVPNIRALRDEIGADRFNACVAAGAAMSYEGLLAWLIAALDAMRDRP